MYLFVAHLLDLLDEDGAQLNLNVSRTLWCKWLPEVKKQHLVNSYALITNVIQKSVTKTNGKQELFTTSDSKLTFSENTNGTYTDLELHHGTFMIETFNFHSNVDKVFTIHKGVDSTATFENMDMFMFLACKHCHIQLPEPPNQMVCESCGLYTPQLVFSKIEMKLKRTMPKRYGENLSRKLHALVPHACAQKIFPNFFDAISFGTERIQKEHAIIFIDELSQYLNGEVKLEASLTIVNNNDDEEVYSALSEKLYLLRDVNIS